MPAIGNCWFQPFRRLSLLRGPFSIDLFAVKPPSLHLFQLACRPKHAGSRRLHPVLALDEELCLSLLLHHPQCPPSPGDPPADCTSIAVPAVVSGSFRTLLKDPFSFPTHPSFFRMRKGESSPSPDQPETPDLGSLADLRLPEGLPGRSESASFLLRKSQAPATRRVFSYVWLRWASWCLARQADPSSAPVTLVVNFLTELFFEGKSYSILIYFSSAISADHS